MKIKLIITFTAIAFLAIACHQYRDLQETNPRMLKPSEAVAYHPPLQLTIAWVPYSEGKLVKTKKHEWKVEMDNEQGKSGNMPLILLTYPYGTDTVWLDMNTSNALLGKLIKHSLMTQEPVIRPFDKFFEQASCQRCHPAEVKVDFEK